MEETPMNNSVLWIGSLIVAVAIAAPAGYLVRDSQIEDETPYQPLGFRQCSYILPETFQVEYSPGDRLYESMPFSSADVPFLNTYADDNLAYAVSCWDDSRDEHIRLVLCWQMSASTSGTLYYRMTFRNNNPNQYSESSNYSLTTAFIDVSGRITLWADIIDANNCSFGIWNPVLQQRMPIIDHYVYREWGWSAQTIAIDEMRFEPD
jgi:hypothetical protein